MTPCFFSVVRPSVSFRPGGAREAPALPCAARVPGAREDLSAQAAAGAEGPGSAHPKETCFFFGELGALLWMDEIHFEPPKKPRFLVISL